MARRQIFRARRSLNFFLFPYLPSSLLPSAGFGEVRQAEHEHPREEIPSEVLCSLQQVCGAGPASALAHDVTQSSENGLLSTVRTRRHQPLTTCTRVAAVRWTPTVAAESALTLPVVVPTISVARCPENAKAPEDCSKGALVRTTLGGQPRVVSHALSARLIFSQYDLQLPPMVGTYQQKDRLSRAVLRFFCPAGQAQQRPWMLSARV